MFPQSLIDQLIKFKTTGERPQGTQSARWRFWKHYGGDEWTVEDGKLYYRFKVVIPREKITDKLKEIYFDPAQTSNGRDKLNDRVHTQYHESRELTSSNSFKMSRPGNST